jgi:hypothetical protein
MSDSLALVAFLAASTIFSLLWGRSLWYLDEVSTTFRRSVFFAMGFTRRPVDEVRALLLTAAYYALGLIASLLFALAFSLPAAALISFSATHLLLSALGAIGQISLTDLLVDLTCRLTGWGGPERFAEIKDIPWMKGLRRLPAGSAPMAAALAGVVEEVFFRGITLRILIDRFKVAPLVAMTAAGVLFYLGQLAQVRTAFQAMVIGCSCVAISTIGGLLVVLTGSVAPAVLCHASFVLFFITHDGGEASVGKAPGKPGA